MKNLILALVFGGHHRRGSLSSRGEHTHKISPRCLELATRWSKSSPFGSNICCKLASSAPEQLVFDRAHEGKKQKRLSRGQGIKILFSHSFFGGDHRRGSLSSRGKHTHKISPRCLHLATRWSKCFGYHRQQPFASACDLCSLGFG